MLHGVYTVLQHLYMYVTSRIVSLLAVNSNYYALGRSTLPSSHWLDRMAMMLYSSVT